MHHFLNKRSSKYLNIAAILFLSMMNHSLFANSYIISSTSHFEHPALRQIKDWQQSVRPFENLIPDKTYKIEQQLKSEKEVIGYITHKSTWTGFHISFRLQSSFSDQSATTLFHIIKSYKQSNQYKLQAAGSTLQFEWDDFEITYLIHKLKHEHSIGPKGLHIRKISFEKDSKPNKKNLIKLNLIAKKYTGLHNVNKTPSSSVCRNSF